jgi:hypothetical protein
LIRAIIDGHREKLAIAAPYFGANRNVLDIDPFEFRFRFRFGSRNLRDQIPI